MNLTHVCTWSMYVPNNALLVALCWCFFPFVSPFGRLSPKRPPITSLVDVLLVYLTSFRMYGVNLSGHIPDANV